MNAAAKVINQSNLFTGHWVAMRISKEQAVLLTLLFMLLFSAIGIIYVTNEYRLTLSGLTQLEKDTHNLRMEWGQLLLEQASLVAPSRVELLASEQFNMHLPKAQAMFIINAK